MIAPARIALLKDAYFQVLDNWVFRILAVICLVFILIPFIVGFREESIVICFGLWEWSYEELLSALGGPGSSGFQSSDVRDQAINFYMELIVQKTVGNFGVIFSIAATSFFVPQMLEKGAADVIFHKPLGRLSFYLSRYFSGVLFVTLLSSVLSVGTYLGFLVASGHNDPGILMGAPLMTYVFALIFSVAMLVGVVTRSTVASILLTCIFFLFNGCVDMIWVGRTEIMLQTERSGISPLDVSRQASSGEESDEEAEEEEEDDEHPVFKVLWNVVSGLHYVLPKTGDADVIAKKLRAAINAPPFQEEKSLLSLLHEPEGLELVELSQGSAPSEFSAEERELLGEVRFCLLPLEPDESDASEALVESEEPEEPQDLEEGEAAEEQVMSLEGLRYTLFRRPTTKTERTRRERVITSTENASKASKELQELILARLAVSGASGEDPEVERKSKNLGRVGISPIPSYRLTWQTASGEGRQAAVFRVGLDWIYTLVVEDPKGEQTPERIREVMDRVGLELGFDISVAAYEEALSLDAPWRYNILFSVGSSIAFVIFVLSIGWWRLTRIDF